MSAYNRRQFIRSAALASVVAPTLRWSSVRAAEPAPKYDTRVAIGACTSYDKQAVRASLKQCFDQLGGIGGLVKGKSVTVKVNLTGTIFEDFLGRPVGETFMSHFSTGFALAQLLMEAGATRIIFAESPQSTDKLESNLISAHWDLKDMEGLGKITYENTRNLGSYKTYGSLDVPTGGIMFSKFNFNRAYTDTDVMVSLCKLKQHLTAGVTLSIKNMFGITPNSLYGTQAGSEEATGGRTNLHSPGRNTQATYPGMKEGITTRESYLRIPSIVADVNAARPIHLAIIDGITSMSGGEGSWCGNAETLKVTTPGVLIVGRNPVCTDAVGTAVMGFAKPNAPRGEGAFKFCENTLLLAEKNGVGTADLAQIEMLGLPLDKARYPYPELRIAVQYDQRKAAAQKAAEQN